MELEYALKLVRTQLAEAHGIALDDQYFKQWRLKTSRTLVRVFDSEHPLVQQFDQNHFASMSLYGEETVDAAAFQQGKESAIAVLEAAAYELDMLMTPASLAQKESFDSDLWDHVAHLVQAEQWAQAASQTAIFAEDRIRQWAGLGEELTGQRLMTAVLHSDKGRFPLGRTDAEREGWYRFGMGISNAIRNVDTHRIQKRPDLKPYAVGVLGAYSLLLTQLRFEHGNRFQD